MGSLTSHIRKNTAALLLIVFAALGTLAAAGCGSGETTTLVVYSGRTQSLVQPLLETYARESGVGIRVKYLDTASVAARLLEEGDRTDADVVFLQDAGALGALSKAGMLAVLPNDLLGQVDSRLRSPTGEWVGTSGRSRVVVYNPQRISPSDMPESIMDFTDPKWKGRLAWAPANASFQAFVTAMRIIQGPDATRAWLRGILANGVRAFPNNIAIVEAVSRAEVDLGFVNHYYLHQFIAERGPEFNARNHFIGDGDVGALINVAGAGVVKSTKHKEEAEKFVRFLLSAEAQHYFTEETFEYPLAAGVPLVSGLKPLAELDPPDVDLSNLDDLQGTLDLMREVGIIP